MRGARDVGDARIRFIKGFLSQLDSPKWKNVKEVVRNIFLVGSGCGCLLFLVLGAVVGKGRWSVVVGNFLKFFPLVAVVFKQIKQEFYFLLKIVFRAAYAMGPT